MNSTHEQREYEQAPDTLYRTQKSDMLHKTFQNVFIFQPNLFYQRKIFLSVCTHFFCGDSQLQSEHVDVLSNSVSIKLREKLRISGHKIDSNTQKNRNFKKFFFLLLNDHNAMNGPIFSSRPNRLFFLPFFTDVNTFKRKSSKFQKLPIFPPWICFALWDKKNLWKNVIKIWWLKAFDNKMFPAY